MTRASTGVRVFLTKPPQTHGAYAEFARTPPPGVTYLWDSPREPAGSVGTSVVAQIFRSIGLPNVHPAVGRSKRADVIHSLQGLLLTGGPWVVDIEHGMPFVGISFDRYRRRLTRAVIERLIAADNCKAVLPWTRTAANGFLATFGRNRAIREKVRVVYPALPLSPLRTGSRATCHLMFVANSPAYNFVVKGGRELLLAFRELSRRHPSARLTIVGPRWTDGSDLGALPGVEWPGIIDHTHLSAIYANADVLVMPSFSDTFGMVFLEAMAHGIPVVALDRPYTSDIIDDGRTGLLAPLGPASIRWCSADGRFLMNSDTFVERMLESEPDKDVAAGLAERLTTLVEHVEFRQQLGLAGRHEVAEGRFSLDRRNRALQEVYESAAATSRGPQSQA